MRLDYFGQELRVGDLVVIPKTGGSSPRPRIGILSKFKKALSCGTELHDHLIDQHNVVQNTSGGHPYKIDVFAWSTNSADKNFIKLDPSVLDTDTLKTYNKYRALLKV